MGRSVNATRTKGGGAMIFFLEALQLELILSDSLDFVITQREDDDNEEKIALGWKQVEYEDS